LRVPIGPGAQEWLRAFHQATIDELDAVSALTGEGVVAGTSAAAGEA
jgi:hypothetical protein